MRDTRVDPQKLRVRVDPDALGFETTADCATGDFAVAQPRAFEAIEFWATVKGDGFNLYASGPSGIGRTSAIRSVLAGLTQDGEPFDDWVYVNNFQDPHHPRAIELPFGTAVPFRDAMVDLIEDLAGAVPAAFEAEDYKTRRSAIEASQQAEQEELIGALRERAAADNLELVRTPMGFALVPSQNGEIVKPEVFNSWPVDVRTAIEKKVEVHQEALATLIREKLPELERAARAQVRELNREVATRAIGLAVSEVAAAFDGIEPIQDHLREVTKDLETHFHLFLALAQAGDEVPLATRLEHPVLRRYAVNVMDATPPDSSLPDAAARTPVIEETDPTLANLVGRIEHQPVEGALITDFTMIKPGALHRANGGYLILEARDLLQQPFAWEALKRCLKTSMLRISSASERFSLVSTILLEPDEIPLSVKVALVGERQLYYLLSALDPDFPSLFKVLADFEDDLTRSDESRQMMATAIAALACDKKLKPLDKTAVAAVLEEASRISDDAAKFSLRIEALSDLMHEAAFWAERGKADLVGAEHVRRAVAERLRRGDRQRLRSAEMIDREIVNIAVTGEAVGQINGLSVLSLGEMRFGRPSRITTRTRMGTGKIIDIEREVKLGGAIHSKGVLILSSFLAARFGQTGPVSLSASIVFEQTYGGVDGDSASSTELYALLSSLAGVPLSQSLAVTGSVDQFGRVQAIGGVNEKIEGFFEICSNRGLTGNQGVLIPASNVQHLNLREDVADAVEAGRFVIHAVEHVDEGIELLTGIAAGEQREDGTWPEDSINGRVAATLAEYAETMRKLMRSGSDKNGEEDEA